MERLKNMDSHFTSAKEQVVVKSVNKLQQYREQSNLDEKLIQHLFTNDDENSHLRDKFQRIFANKKIFEDETQEEDTREERRTKINARIK